MKLNENIKRIEQLSVDLDEYIRVYRVAEDDLLEAETLPQRFVANTQMITALNSINLIAKELYKLTEDE